MLPTRFLKAFAVKGICLEFGLLFRIVSNVQSFVIPGTIFVTLDVTLDVTLVTKGLSLTKFVE